ncbi:MAG TPA: response regulator transcription factor [Ignavibacteriales bacterium]|nr:response regulator transcription factor [Ignavibacteriales bacterium]
MTNIIIADDHPVVRTGLKQFLNDESGLNVIGEAENYTDVITLLQENTCDLLLLDISMPGMNGLEILRQIRNSYPETKVLILSVHPEEQYAIRAFKEGASGYITKDSAPDELIKAVNKIMEGGKYVSPRFAEKLAENILPDNQGPLHNALSNREFDVMVKIAQGKSLTEISEDLFISIKTVSAYRSRILHKLNMTNNAELVQYCLREKLI